MVLSSGVVLRLSTSLAVFAVACTTAPASTDLPQGSSGGSGSSTTVDDEPEGSTSGGVVDECAWVSSQSPEVAQEVVFPDGFQGYIAPASGGGFYAASTRLAGSGGENRDVFTLKLGSEGEVLWTAMWGHPYGWYDAPLALTEAFGGLAVGGVAGAYDSQEYPYPGIAFVRAYGAGGAVAWTWVDESGLVLGSDLGSVLVLGHGPASLVLVEQAADQSGVERLQFVRFSAEGEVLGRWEHAQEGVQPLAARVDDVGDVWVVAETTEPALGHWTAEGEFVGWLEFEDGASRLTRAAAFGPQGSLVVVGARVMGQDKRMVVSRFDEALGNPRSAEVEIDGGPLWEYFLEVDVACDGTAWVTGFSQAELPLIAFDEAAEERWRLPGLATVAVHDDGTALMVEGTEQGETLVRVLRATED